MTLNKFIFRRWLLGFGLAFLGIVIGAALGAPATAGIFAVPGVLLVMDASVIVSVGRGLSLDRATDEQQGRADAFYLASHLVARRNITTLTVSIISIAASLLIRDINIVAGVSIVVMVLGMAVFAWDGVGAWRAAGRRAPE